MQDIQNRDDIFKLITRFYAKVRKDDLLGPIFNGIIKDWPHHLNHITDFWTRNLLGTVEFYGNPGRKHMQIDEHENNTIEQKHFDTWLGYWYETMDQMYEGEIAELAKAKATTIGQNFFRMILNNRAAKFSQRGPFNGGGFSFGQ